MFVCLVFIMTAGKKQSYLLIWYCYLASCDIFISKQPSRQSDTRDFVNWCLVLSFDNILGLRCRDLIILIHCDNAGVIISPYATQSPFHHFHQFTRNDIDGLVQVCSNSSALALGLIQSFTKPSIWALIFLRPPIKLHESWSDWKRSYSVHV